MEKLKVLEIQKNYFKIESKVPSNKKVKIGTKDCF
jgi:hypothetical protein